MTCMTENLHQQSNRRESITHHIQHTQHPHQNRPHSVWSHHRPGTETDTGLGSYIRTPCSGYTGGLWVEKKPTNTMTTKYSIYTWHEVCHMQTFVVLQEQTVVVYDMFYNTCQVTTKWLFWQVETSCVCLSESNRTLFLAQMILSQKYAMPHWYLEYYVTLTSDVYIKRTENVLSFFGKLNLCLLDIKRCTPPCSLK